LCLIDLAKQLSYVRNTFGSLQSLHNFIGASSKRNAIFETIQSETACTSKSVSLKSLCETRWNCRTDALNSVFTNFSTIINTLEHISDNDINSGSEAKSLLNNIQNFEFVFCLIVLKDILEYTNILSKYLQSVNINYATVIDMSNSTINIIKQMRSEIEFNNKWNEAMEMIKTNNIDPPKIPRKKNVPYKLGGGEKGPQTLNLKDYYRIEIYYPVLDIIIREMQQRFQENQLDILNGLKEIIVNDNPPHEALNIVCNTYNFDLKHLNTEIEVYNRMFKLKYPKIETTSTMAKKIEFIKNDDFQNGFPILTSIIRIFLTIPTTTASCERSFSCLKRLKTYLRTTMGQERLSNLGTLQIEKKRNINIEEVIDEFNNNSSVNSRKLSLK